MNDSPYLQADGTRYLLLLCQWGGYVIDRSYRIRRVQLRAPATSAPHPHKLFGCGPCPTPLTAPVRTRVSLPASLLHLPPMSSANRDPPSHFPCPFGGHHPSA